MFCKQCGSEMEENQAFCSKCGAKVKEEEPGGGAQAMKMHCPRCGGTHLMVQANNRVVSSVSAGRKVGKKHAVGTTSYQTEKESFWFCQDCGMQFRDLDEQQELIAKDRKMATLEKVGTILMAILLVLFIAIGLDAIAIVGSVFLLVLVVIAWIFFDRRAKKRQGEYDGLLPKVYPGFKASDEK